MFAVLGLIAAALLFDDEQAGSGDLEDETVFRQDAGGPPDPDAIAVRPHPQMDPGALDGGGNAGQG